MGRIKYLSLSVIFAATVSIQTQTPQDAIEAERELRMRQMREFDTKKTIKKGPEASLSAPPTVDKATGERIRVARRIDAADIARYNEFLRRDNTGIFKLFPDFDCVAKNVIRIDGDCKDFVFASSSWSFRKVGYSHPYYHDLGFNHGEIYSNPFFAQGILVALGDVPIEGLAVSEKGLKFLLDFEPAPDPAKAKNAATKLSAGIESGGFKYASHLGPSENTTYALRSIAYNLANTLPSPSETTSTSELRFHTLALDKRADVIVVFRVIRKGVDGSLTIIWRELERKEAPKIRFSKGERFSDFKPDNLQLH